MSTTETDSANQSESESTETENMSPQLRSYKNVALPTYTAEPIPEIAAKSVLRDAGARHPNIDQHYRLEILESRINYSWDREHRHPAVIAETERKLGEIQITPEEKVYKKHYKPILYKQTIPDFWEPRPWDKDEDKLTRDATQKLESDISQQSTIPIDDPIYIINREDNRDRAATEEGKSDRRPSRGHLYFKAPQYDYNTDFSSDETDLECISGISDMIY